MKQLLIILTLLALPLSVQSINTDRKSPPSLSHKQLVEIEHDIIYGIRQADSLVNAGKPDEALSFYKKSLKAKRLSIQPAHHFTNGGNTRFV